MARSARAVDAEPVDVPLARAGWRLRVRRTLPYRPGVLTWVLGGSALVVLGLSITIATNVSAQLRDAASAAAIDNAEAIVRGYVDPILTEQDLGIDAVPDPVVSEQLERLVLSDDMKRINVWTRDGRILYSTEASLQGERLGVDHQLAQALAGQPIPEFGERDDSPTEAGLPHRYLEIHAPIRGALDGNPIGVFEVYLDAAPIEARVAATRETVLVTSLGAGAVLLVLLWLAFAGTSRRLASQNASLSRLNEQLGAMATDLRQREARFRSLVHNSSDVVSLVAEDGRITYESDAVGGVLGREPSSRIGRRFVDDMHPSDAALGASLLEGLVADPARQQSAQLRLRHADGGWRWVEVVGQNRLAEAPVGALVLNYRDVTARKQLEDQLEHEAFHDPLTGLANRALFSDRVAHSLARGSRRPGDASAVLFIDLDDFKLVNDSLGHAAGDALLTAVAERIRACLRAEDTAARLGGDEFAILLEDAGAGSAEEIAERLLEALRQPFSVADRQLFMQASIGIATGGGLGRPADRETADDLLRNADAAMYTAKARGGGRHQLYEPTMHAAALRRIDLRERLEAALASEEFQVHYQPVVALVGGRIAGAEALVRWHQSDGAVVGPAEFLSVAEDTGLIVPLGARVLADACREAASWTPADVTIAVNVASRQLADPEFPATVVDILARSGLHPGRLVLEVTESALLDEGRATVAIAELKEVGVRIALDDFGTGYSSLSHLRRFPIDVLKIDRSFIDAIDGDNGDERALVRSIVRLAQSLRLEVVAEGIERSGQLDVLRAFGANLGQGFLFARPLEADAFRRLLRASARLAG